MNVYVYQAELLCGPCGTTERTKLFTWGTYDPNREYPRGYFTEDSGSWPQGPYPDGGGEADTPQHCGRCGLFLENDLTGGLKVLIPRPR